METKTATGSENDVVGGILRESLVTRFPSLSGPFSNGSAIVGLYFCSAWCPDCVKSTPFVEKVIASQNKDDEDVLVEVLYVSSDRSAQEMKDFQPPVFSSIPFDSVQERSDLKRLFGACAKKEMDELSLTREQRKSGIPTLVLLESKSGLTLTTAGVDDCMTSPEAAQPEQVLKKWKAMLENAKHGDGLSLLLDRESLVNRFPSLSEPFSRAPILGLYFCASWCPDCVQATPFLEKVISSQTNGSKVAEVLIEVVYVSSDASEQEMKEYQPTIFSSIPFASEKERSELKRLFGACAKKEIEELGLTAEQRKSGTPTLVLLEASSGRLLTTTAVDDFMVEGANAEDILSKWKALLSS